MSHEEPNQESTSDPIYYPSMNSGIFGSYIHNVENVADNYRPSVNSGIFGTYLYDLPNEEIEDTKESKKQSKQETNQNTNELVEETKEPEKPNYNYYRYNSGYYKTESISDEYREVHKEYCSYVYDETKPIEPISDEAKEVINGMKEYCKTTGKTFVKVTPHDYNKSGIVNTIGINADSKTFNKNKFIKQYCDLYGLHESQVNVISVNAGSLIIKVFITNTEDHSCDLENITKMVSEDDNLNKKLKEMKAFCLLFDKPKKHPDWKDQYEFKKTVAFNSQYDRIYGPGNVHWEGNLEDGKDRGKFSYYCPKGWFKRAVTYKMFTSQEFDEKFKGWPIGYHGTKFEFGMSMLFSGFIPSVEGKRSRTRYGNGVYISPSIIYSAHEAYAKPMKIPQESKKYLKQFGDGNWIQFVFQCRIHPDAINKIAPDSMGTKTQIDPNFSNDEVIWVVGDEIVHDPEKDNCQVYIVGLMIRVTKEHPRELEESKWWRG